MSFINIGVAYLEGTEVENQYNKGVYAAGQIQKQTLGLLGEQKGIAGQQAGLEFQKAQAQYTSGVGGVGFATNMELRRSQAFGEQSYAQSNLATSGTIEQKVGMQTGDIMAKYKSDMANLFESRSFAEKEKTIARSKADLAFRTGEMSAEQAYEETIAGLEEGGGAAYAWDETLNQINEREQMAQKMATG